MGIPITASKLAHAFACGWAFRSDVTVPRETVGEPALTGSAFAALRADVVSGGAMPYAPVPGADEARARRSCR